MGPLWNAGFGPRRLVERLIADLAAFTLNDNVDMDDRSVFWEGDVSTSMVLRDCVVAILDETSPFASLGFPRAISGPTKRNMLSKECGYRHDLVIQVSHRKERALKNRCLKYPTREDEKRGVFKVLCV